MKKFVFILSLLVSSLSIFFTSCDPKNPIAEDSVISLLEEGVMKGELKEDYTLDATVPYSLTGAFVVSNGATLTIPAGTSILATASNGQETETYIAVMTGSKIYVEGTASQPVVMQSPSSNPGDWGGLTICGRAVTTEGAPATAEVGNFQYGGSNAADNSGSISYLVIKGSGAAINPDSEYNGLTLYAVGSGTTINNVAIINGADDGVEFFGGSVSVSNLYLENNEDDAIDWTEGWDGTVTNAYVKHSISNFSTVVEADGVNNNPQINNLTAVSTQGGTALQFKKQSGATMTNVYLEGYSTLVDMKDEGPLSNVIIEGNTATLEGPYQTGQLDISAWNWFK